LGGNMLGANSGQQSKEGSQKKLPIDHFNYSSSLSGKDAAGIIDQSLRHFDKLVDS
jgi:hypothetical protein